MNKSLIFHQHIWAHYYVQWFPNNIILNIFSYFWYFLFEIAFPFLISCFIFLLGYLEDRRPASNMDPYIVTSLLAETTILWEPTLEAEALAAQKLALKV